MAAIPTNELAALAARHGLKPDDIVWADRNPFGLLIGLKNGTSKNYDPAEPAPRSMNR